MKKGQKIENAEVRSEPLKNQYQKKLKNQFKKADREGAKYVITLGEKELANGVLNIKRLADGKTIDLSLEDLNNMTKIMDELKD